MKQITVILISIITFSTAYSQNSIDPILLTIDGKNITKSEFEQVFWKNKKENITNKEELDEYIDLYKKFRLKIAAAEAMGLDTSKKFKSELAGYQSQLERPYLVDTTLNEALLKEAYNRIKNEVKASHILVGVKPNATKEDTLQAYKKITNIRLQILEGKISFEEAAVKYSTDPSAKQNKGNLGFFSAFRMVYPFENSAFNTKVGEISEPFRTQFGYHIVKPTELRKGRGKVKVAHIMIRVKDDMVSSERENLKKKAEEIYEKIKQGGDYIKLAQEFSDDRNSAKKGGEIGWINTGETFFEFDNAAFNLKKNNEVSKPIKSPVGWHIIRRLDYKPVGTFEEMRTELKHKTQKDIRSQKTRTQFISNLKKEYGFIENKELLNKIQKDTSKSLFSFANKSYSIGLFNEYLKNNKIENTFTQSKEIDNLYNRYVSNKLVEFEKTQLEDKYPEYKALLREYREGILLFEITDKMVWSKAIKDTTGLKEFYNKTKNNYMWSDRIVADIFSSNNKSIIKKAYKLSKKGKIKSDSIVNYLNKDSQLNINLESGTFKVEENKHTKSQNWKKGINKPRLINNKHVFCNVKKLLPNRPKELNEAKGIITAAYQEYLENEWLKELENKHKITVNKSVLHSINKK